jgi:class 3 adenylate cyclase
MDATVDARVLPPGTGRIVWLRRRFARMADTRKTVTVVFTDVVGSTSLGERLDPEALRHVMSRLFAELRPVLERHGGSVAKFIGDAILAVFAFRSCTRTTRCGLSVPRQRWARPLAA